MKTYLIHRIRSACILALASVIILVGWSLRPARINEFVMADFNDLPYFSFCDGNGCYFLSNEEEAALYRILSNTDVTKKDLLPSPSFSISGDFCCLYMYGNNEAYNNYPIAEFYLLEDGPDFFWVRKPDGKHYHYEVCEDLDYEMIIGILKDSAQGKEPVKGFTYPRT